MRVVTGNLRIQSLFENKQSILSSEANDLCMEKTKQMWCLTFLFFSFIFIGG